MNIYGSKRIIIALLITIVLTTLFTDFATTAHAEQLASQAAAPAKISTVVRFDLSTTASTVWAVLRNEIGIGYVYHLGGSGQYTAFTTWTPEGKLASYSSFDQALTAVIAAAPNDTGIGWSASKPATQDVTYLHLVYVGDGVEIYSLRTPDDTEIGIIVYLPHLDGSEVWRAYASTDIATHLGDFLTLPAAINAIIANAEREAM